LHNIIWLFPVIIEVSDFVEHFNWTQWFLLKQAFRDYLTPLPPDMQKKVANFFLGSEFLFNFAVV